MLRIVIPILVDFYNLLMTGTAGLQINVFEGFSCVSHIKHEMIVLRKLQHCHVYFTRTRFYYVWRIREISSQQLFFLKLIIHNDLPTQI